MIQKSNMPEDFASFGAGNVAYLREMNTSELAEVYPNIPQIETEMKLWALISADGTPIVFTDCHLIAQDKAKEAKLETLSLH